MEGQVPPATTDRESTTWASSATRSAARAVAACICNRHTKVTAKGIKPAKPRQQRKGKA